MKLAVVLPALAVTAGLSFAAGSYFAPMLVHRASQSRGSTLSFAGSSGTANPGSGASTPVVAGNLLTTDIYSAQAATDPDGAMT